MATVAMVVGWMVIGCVGVLCLAVAVSALASAADRWQERRRLTRQIEHLAYEGRLILWAERNRRAMQ